MHTGCFVQKSAYKAIVRPNERGARCLQADCPACGADTRIHNAHAHRARWQKRDNLRKDKRSLLDRLCWNLMRNIEDDRFRIDVQDHGFEGADVRTGRTVICQ